MVSNHQAIRDNITPGDILLSRDVRARATQEVNGIVKSRWDEMHVYVEGHELLGQYLDRKYAVGLFRVPGLTEKKRDKLLAQMQKLTKPGFFKRIWLFILKLIGKSRREMTDCEMTATAYKKIGIEIKCLPPDQVGPADFDDSPVTVRVA